MYKTLSAPLTAQIELCNVCTSKCVHCYNFWRREPFTKKHLSVEQIELILKKLADAKVFDIIITGGEPLLNKKGLLKCLEDSQKYGIGVSLNSNLLPLTEKYVKDLKERGIESILTSIHGPNAEIHDNIVQTKGAFDKLSRSIHLALYEEIRIIANMVVHRANLNYVKETARAAHSLGIKKFTSTRAGCPGNCVDFSNISISLEEFRGYLRDLYEIGQELSIDTDVLESYPLCGIRELDTFNAFTGRKCLAGVTTFTIGCDGDVRPCTHQDISYGNILSEDVSDIWARMMEWRNGKLIPDICQQCQLLPLCGAGCRMEAKTINGSLSSMDPYSSPEDIAHCIQTLENRKKKNLENTQSIKNISSFSLNPKIRWREEAFGSVIISKKSCVYLDHNGTNIFKQLQKGKVYLSGDDKIDWSGLNPEDFLFELDAKNVIKGGDINVEGRV